MSQLWLVPEEVETYIKKWDPQGVFAKIRQQTIVMYAAKQNKRKFPEFNRLGKIQSNKSWMMVSGDVISFLQNLVLSSNAKKCLDLGTFTGSSALAMALHLPEDGVVISCDVDPEPIVIAKNAWAKAGVATKVQFHLQAAASIMQQALASADMFDLIFLDAQNRSSYADYYEMALRLLPVGGSLVIDNAFMFGHVMDPESSHINGQHIAEVNKKIMTDSRVNASLLSISDGVLWLLKK